ncbi:hypothetical protein GYMLUDRAFT_39863 [Collybiopsis luxurians FD-317 M1]|nr:hypothetical protein GYMLUDRAFT_39863 [Collybiopsis luxurians FD-317 M1]
MSIVKLALGVCAVVHGIEVLAVPQQITSPSPATVTLYQIIPTGLVDPDTSIDGTIEFEATAVGVSSGSDGSETTYSVGEYISENSVFTTITTNSQGQIVTETTKTPEYVGNINWTMIVSEGGEWETEAPFTSTDLLGDEESGQGYYLSCSFDGSHQSASCTQVGVDLVVSTTTFGSETATVTGAAFLSTTFGGSLTPFTVITQGVPSRTGSGSTTASTGTSTGTSNAATGKQMYYGLGYFVIFVTVVLNL